MLPEISLFELSVNGYSFYGCAARFVSRHSAGLFLDLAEFGPSKGQVIQLATRFIIRIDQFLAYGHINVAGYRSRIWLRETTVSFASANASSKYF